jgi:APA family basic amino acid/polyamine antiporter
MGRDIPAMRFFASPGEVPLRPLLFQSAFAIVLVIAGDFEFLVNFTQTGLTLCTFLTVFGLIILRFRGELVSLASLATALIFVAFTGFVIVRMFSAGPVPAITGIATAIVCALLWFPVQRFSK